jgi:hypothetical protein
MPNIDKAIHTAFFSLDKVIACQEEFEDSPEYQKVMGYLQRAARVSVREDVLRAVFGLGMLTARFLHEQKVDEYIADVQKGPQC